MTKPIILKLDFKVIKVIKLIKLVEGCFVKLGAYHLNQVSRLVMIKFKMVLMLRANIMMKFNNPMHWEHHHLLIHYLLNRLHLQYHLHLLEPLYLLHLLIS